MQTASYNEKLSFPHYALVAGIAFLLWLLLVGSLDRQELVAGALVSVLVAIAAGPRLGLFAGLRLSPAAPLYMLSYLAHFFVELVRANLDLARRILTPSLPIRPAVVEVRTRLQSSLGKMVLANSITLTPGTLTVSVRGDRLLVHWVYCPPGTDMTTATERIAAGFERHLSGFLK